MPDALPRVFISYARADSAAFVDRLEGDLKVHQFHPWVDRHGLEGGQQWLRMIQRAIDECQAMIVVLSPAAVESKFVSMEYLYADKKGKLVVPALHLPTDAIPMYFHILEWVDFQSNYEEGLRKLIQALSHLKAPAASTLPAQDKPPQPQAAPPGSEPPHQQRATEAPNPVVEPIKIQVPDTRPDRPNWWVAVACPQDGVVENLNTWHVVYASWDDTKTWYQIDPEAQPYCEGAKDAKGFARHKLTKSHRALSRSLRRYFDALHWETPFAVDWLEEHKRNNRPSPRGDL